LQLLISPLFAPVTNATHLSTFIVCTSFTIDFD